MPHDVYTNVTIQDGDRSVQFAYERWSDAQGSALVSVHGKTDADHNYLAQNRADVAEMLRQEEGCNHLDYCESQGNGLHTQMRLETDDTGKIVGAEPVHGASLSSGELNRRGQQLLEVEHEHLMNLESHSFGEQAQAVRNENAPSPGF